MKNGLLILPCGERSIRFRPALNIGKDVLDEGLKLFADSITSTHKYHTPKTNIPKIEGFTRMEFLKELEFKKRTSAQAPEPSGSRAPATAK